MLGVCFREATEPGRDTVITHGHTDAKCQKWELNLSLASQSYHGPQLINIRKTMFSLISWRKKKKKTTHTY